jgi:hypothetical protein
MSKLPNFRQAVKLPQPRASLLQKPDEAESATPGPGGLSFARPVLDVSCLWFFARRATKNRPRAFNVNSANCLVNPTSTAGNSRAHTERGDGTPARSAGVSSPLPCLFIKTVNTVAPLYEFWLRRVCSSRWAILRPTTSNSLLRWNGWNWSETGRGWRGSRMR